MQGHPDGSSVSNVFERSFIEELTGSGNDIFEGGLKFLASEAREKFNITASSEREVIGEQLGCNRGVISE